MTRSRLGVVERERIEGADGSERDEQNDQLERVGGGQRTLSYLSAWGEGGATWWRCADEREAEPTGVGAGQSEQFRSENGRTRISDLRRLFLVYWVLFPSSARVQTPADQ
jgi:hypothetical protein